MSYQRESESSSNENLEYNTEELEAELEEERVLEKLKEKLEGLEQENKSKKRKLQDLKEENENLRQYNSLLSTLSFFMEPMNSLPPFSNISSSITSSINSSPFPSNACLFSASMTISSHISSSPSTCFINSQINTTTSSQNIGDPNPDILSNLLQTQQFQALQNPQPQQQQVFQVAECNFNPQEEQDSPLLPTRKRKLIDQFEQLQL